MDKDVNNREVRREDDGKRTAKTTAKTDDNVSFLRLLRCHLHQYSQLWSAVVCCGLVVVISHTGFEQCR